MTTISRYRALRWSLFKSEEGQRLQLVDARLWYPPNIHKRQTANLNPNEAALSLSTRSTNKQFEMSDYHGIAEDRPVPAPSNWTPEGYTGRKGARFSQNLGQLGGVNSVHMNAYTNPHDPDAPGLAHVLWANSGDSPEIQTKQYAKQLLPRYHDQYGGSRGEAGQMARASLTDDLWQHANHDRHIYAPAMQQLASHILDHDPSHEHDAVAIGGTIMPVRLGDLANGRHAQQYRQGKGTVTGYTNLPADGSAADDLGTDKWTGSAMDGQHIAHIPGGNHIPGVHQVFGQGTSTHLIHVPVAKVTNLHGDPLRSVPDHEIASMWTHRSLITRANVMDLGDHMRTMAGQDQQHDFPHQYFAPRQYGDQE